MKKAQGGIEFMIVFGAMFFFFIIFLLVIQQNVSEKNLEKENVVATNIALGVRDEIALASTASEGYYREFKIPDNLLGKDYTIAIIDQRIFISAEKNRDLLPTLECNRKHHKRNKHDKKTKWICLT